MHSAEPIEPDYVDDPSQPNVNDAAWRAEVASRVSSYRARKCSGNEQSPARDFSPATEAQIGAEQNSGSRNLGTQDPAAQGQEAQSRATSRGGHLGNMARSPASRIAFDTNYYRRLNAESISGLSLGETADAMVPARESEAEPEADSDAGLKDPVLGDVEASCRLVEEALDDLRPQLELRATVAENSILQHHEISEPEAKPETIAPAATRPSPIVQGNLIVFRRPLMEPPLEPQPSRDELAEPMNYRPRILEVPEDIMPAVQGSLFPEIRLDADEPETSNHREPEIQVPLRVAPISERLIASFVDMGVVIIAWLMFAWMAWRALPEIPHTKPFFMTLGVVTLLFWAVYQHLFLLYGGRTPGMKMRGIRLSTFDGQAPEWKHRSSRARFMLISFASVALGFLWALVDEDTLCWHDRVSRTFPTSE
jgi:uncharacterized RDD family membrane protein YckC